MLKLITPQFFLAVNFCTLTNYQNFGATVLCSLTLFRLGFFGVPGSGGGGGGVSINPKVLTQLS